MDATIIIACVVLAAGLLLWAPWTRGPVEPPRPEDWEA